MLNYQDWSQNQKTNEKKEDTYEYGCAMVYFDSPITIEVGKMISPEDLYEEEGDRSYGIEDEPHVTLLYGLHSGEIDDERVMEICCQEIPSMKLHNVSAFENSKYDVLKFDVECEKLHDINSQLSQLPHTTDYPDYHPHSTVAYLKPGMGKKYIEMCKDKWEAVTPTKIVYSKADGTKLEREV